MEGWKCKCSSGCWALATRNEVQARWDDFARRMAGERLLGVWFGGEACVQKCQAEVAVGPRCQCPCLGQARLLYILSRSREDVAGLPSRCPPTRWRRHGSSGGVGGFRRRRPSVFLFSFLVFAYGTLVMGCFRARRSPDPADLLYQSFMDDFVIFVHGASEGLFQKFSRVAATCRAVCAGLGLHMFFEQEKTEAMAVFRGKGQDRGGPPSAGSALS